MKVLATNNMARQCVEIYALGDGERGAMHIIKHEEGYLCPPTMEITYEQARTLMDSLMDAGVRPTNAGSLGQVTAMQSHIDDLRTIAFKMVKI